MLFKDSLLSRIEYVLFLDVKSKMPLFITFHVNHELVNESNVQRKFLRRLYKKLFNVFLWNEFLLLDLHLDKFICIFELLKERKWNWVFISEIDLNPLDWFIINIQHSRKTFLNLLFKLRSQLLTLINGQSV